MYIATKIVISLKLVIIPFNLDEDEYDKVTKCCSYSQMDIDTTTYFFRNCKTCNVA